MARTLDRFPSMPGRTQHPWSEYLDGRVWELTPGEDFTAKVPTFKASAQAQAKKRGGRVRTRTLREGDRETLVIQFVR